MPNYDHLDIILDPVFNPLNLLHDDLREALIEKLKEVAERESPDLSLNDFCSATGISPRTVRLKFPRWSEFRQAAGLTPEPKRRGWGGYETNQLREKFLQFVAEQGERVTLYEFCRYARVAPATITRHFGGFTKLRLQAGLQPNPPARNRYTDEQIHEFYHQVVEQLRRTPPQPNSTAAPPSHTRHSACVSAKTARSNDATANTNRPAIDRIQASGGRKSPDACDDVAAPICINPTAGLRRPLA